MDRQLAKALSHPIRVEILQALRNRVASPDELSREMDEKLGVISYHASALAWCGFLELIDTRPRQGSIERFFAATPRSPL